ncbi:LytR C-terminal domain-containing protein [Luteimicrobium sp. NPDC057192]|uniref:LytR C-terminal domain-containing protein n=1 Tax=Luteimicrobium sp. NPDC057192 TaxID=3346042 RepID=UPI0036275036
MANQHQPPTPRELRRRHMHERQAVVFGVLLAALALVGVGAAGIMTGAISSPFSKPIATPTQKDDAMTTAVPCLPKGTKPVKYSEITLNVYNASGQPGLARSTADALTERGFTIKKVGNDSSKIVAPRVVFGKRGLYRAYTVAAQLKDAKLAYDGRKDGSVDVVLGTESHVLLATKDVHLNAKKAMKSAPGCVPLAKVTPLPAAPKATPKSTSK